MRWLVLLALTGCLKTAAYPCNQKSDCLRGAEEGFCESNNFCSFADPTCGPDGHRYGDLSGASSGQCVAPETPDAGVDSPIIDPDMMVIDEPPPTPFCDPTDTTQVACWEFENALTDGSGSANTAVGTGTFSFVAGKVGLAVEQTASAHLTVADSASLQPGSVTIEAWIKPTTTSAARMGIFDNQNSYGFFINPNLAGLQCTTMSTTTALPLDVFTHVACVYEANVGGHLYVNGVEVATAAAGLPLGAGDVVGSVIGGDSPGPANPLLGQIDQMRVWNVARTAAQICAATGQTTCP